MALVATARAKHLGANASWTRTARSRRTDRSTRAPSLQQLQQQPPPAQAAAAPLMPPVCIRQCGGSGAAATAAPCSRKSTAQALEQYASSAPPTTNASMPKVRNRNQPTTAITKPAMHRKSKSKSNNSPFASIAMPPTLASVLQQILPLPLTTQTLPSTPSTLPLPPTATTITTTRSPTPSITSPTSPTTATTTTAARIAALQHHAAAAAAASSTKGSGSHRSRQCNASVRRIKFLPLPTLGATSFVTLLTLICIETVLLSTMSNCAKTFYMHWNTSNSIFRIDNTDHIIDVNKGNLAFEFDQVHIICPVYEPGTFENETEKYIIYNVSKVEYETCRITNADPRVIAICDKPQKLMFFTITFRPFTPQPGGLEFLPGNDYYFISTSSKDDLYRRIGGRCSTNNMKVVFKVCCAAEEKNKTTPATTAIGAGGADVGAGTGVDNSAVNMDMSNAAGNANHGHGHHMGTAVNTIGISGVNIANGGMAAGGGGGVQLKPINGVGTSINTNIDQFNRIPMQPNMMGNNIGSGVDPGRHNAAGGGIMLSPGHGSINMLPPGRGGGGGSGVNIAQYPGHHHIQTGIRINNVPTNQNYPPHKGNHNGNVNGNVNGNDDHHHYDKHPNEVVKNEELTYNSGAAGSSNACVWLSLLAMLHWLRMRSWTLNGTAER